MNPRLTLALAASLFAATGVRADSWAFSFTNLCSPAACIELDGHFSGQDGNGDGHLALNELTALEAGGYQFFPAWISRPGDPPGGGSTASFDYAIGGALNFSGSASYYRIAVAVTTGSLVDIIGPIPEAGTYFWTPQTVQQVTPVPEPASAALLGIGLLAWRARRACAWSQG